MSFAGDDPVTECRCPLVGCDRVRPAGEPQRRRPHAAGRSTHHDGVFRLVFGKPAHAASHLRAVLPPALTARLDLDQLTAVDSSFVDPELTRRHCDVLLRTRAAGRIGRAVDHLDRPDTHRHHPRRALRLTARPARTERTAPPTPEVTGPRDRVLLVAGHWRVVVCGRVRSGFDRWRRWCHPWPVVASRGRCGPGWCRRAGPRRGFRSSRAWPGRRGRPGAPGGIAVTDAVLLPALTAGR